VKPWHRAVFILAVAALACSWLVWKCLRDPSINFLPADPRAVWIVFPAAVDARAHQVAMLDATFRRTISIDSPAGAHLFWRAFKQTQIKINGERIGIGVVRNWKNMSVVDVSSFLRSGPNQIEARVFNDNGPPAVWVALIADSSAKVIASSNEKWEASLAGSEWRSCALAQRPQHPGPGNLLAGGETIVPALRQVWPWWILFGAITIVLTFAGKGWLDRTANRQIDVDLTRAQLWTLIGFCIFAWLILFWNNSKTLPFHAGYDSKDHLAYIKYIQTRWSLPLPNEGFEMFQPPLYYVLAAAALSICRLSVADAASVTILRSLGMLFGIANFIFVFLSVRLLFPKRPILHIAALLLAAFLPMQLYLCHYVTNETLAATMASATLYFAVRMFDTNRRAVWVAVVVGVCAGAALLAKATAFLLIPALLGAFALKILQQRDSFSFWLRASITAMLTTLIVSGWYYFRIWRHFGTAVVGNWNPVLGFLWWQEPGFHTANDYFRFGQSLLAPLFSGLNGFGDGIYSTLWGDSLCGGLSGLLARTPWNYSFFIAGNWIGLVPTVLVAAGVAIGVYRFIRKPSAEAFLFLGFSAAVSVAVIFMTLRVASYAQVKAFYGLSALVPFCWFAITTWQFLANRWRILHFAFASVLILLCINSFASVWIRESTATRLYNAARLDFEGKTDIAISDAEKAVALDRSSAIAHRMLSLFLLDAGQLDPALEHSKRAVEISPLDSDAHTELSAALLAQIRLQDAAAEARRAIELGQENFASYDSLITALRKLGQTDEAIATLQKALAISPYNSELHLRYGLAAGQSGDFATAAQQFVYCLVLGPDQFGARDKLEVALRLLSRSPEGPQRIGEIAAFAKVAGDTKTVALCDQFLNANQ
jgi:tetratricopeptide (TPR) repeat protein